VTKQLYVRYDPADLERFTKKNIPRRRNIPPEKAHHLELFKRGLQALPPRELNMLFTHDVNRVEQDEVATLHNVRQSNISYRLDRCRNRVQLFVHLNTITSETSLRARLFDLGLNEQAVRAVIGVVKTTSQTATAEALNISQGSVRHTYATAQGLLEKEEPDSPELFLLLEVSRNFNKLRAIKTQSRWDWKVDGGNYPNA